MEGTGEVLKVPGVDLIIRINRRFIEESAEEFIGDDNLLNRPSLEYILQAITQRPFGQDLFPTIYDKAAAVAERIILHHVFYGACKRTALMTCATFLKMNGYDMQIHDSKRFDEEAIEKAMALQEKQITVEAFVDWIKSRTIPLGRNENNDGSSHKPRNP